jgi:small-conductance mechanosensitive channel
MSDESVQELHQSENSPVISHPMPALRLNQRETSVDIVDIEAQREPETSDAETGATTKDVVAPLSSWIRPLRGVVGIVLLALAWVGLVGIALLVHGATDAPLKLWPPSLRFLLPVVQLIAALWIGLIVATLIFLGSFLIWLALTVRGW